MDELWRHHQTLLRAASSQSLLDNFNASRRQHNCSDLSFHASSISSLTNPASLVDEIARMNDETNPNIIPNPILET